jgi:imidazolonepropionase-like amidohydrolase
MKTLLSAFFLLAALLLAPWLCAQSTPPTTPSASAAPDAVVEKPLAITNTRLVDGKTGRVDSSVTILVQGQRIVAVGPASKIVVPPGAQIIDGSAFWAIPGIVDAHSHVGAQVPVMKLALSLGITTVHNMPGLRAAKLDLQTPSWDPGALTPRQVVTTPLFSGPYVETLAPGGFDVRTPTSPAEAQIAVRNVYEQGGCRIKICQEDAAAVFGPEKAVANFSPEILEALVGQARALQMRVMVHVTAREQTRQVVRTGCDVLMHGVHDAIVDDELWREVRQKGIFLCPTLAVVLTNADGRAYARRILADERWGKILDSRALAEQRKKAEEWKSGPKLQHLADNSDRYWANLIANTRAAHAHGIPIVVGSDQRPGLHTHLEMELLTDAGLSPAEVLVAATWNGARALGLENEIGSVEVGKLADFVLLRSDPTVDIRNARDTEIVVKGGRPYLVSELREPNPAPAAKLTVASPGNK